MRFRTSYVQSHQVLSNLTIANPAFIDPSSAQSGTSITSHSELADVVVVWYMHPSAIRCRHVCRQRCGTGASSTSLAGMVYRSCVTMRKEPTCACLLSLGLHCRSSRITASLPAVDLTFCHARKYLSSLPPTIFSMELIVRNTTLLLLYDSTRCLLGMIDVHTLRMRLKGSAFSRSWYR